MHTGLVPPPGRPWNRRKCPSEPPLRRSPSCRPAHHHTGRSMVWVKCVSADRVSRRRLRSRWGLRLSLPCRQLMRISDDIHRAVSSYFSQSGVEHVKSACSPIRTKPNSANNRQSQSSLQGYLPNSGESKRNEQWPTGTWQRLDVLARDSPRALQSAPVCETAIINAHVSRLDRFGNGT